VRKLRGKLKESGDVGIPKKGERGGNKGRFKQKFKEGHVRPFFEAATKGENERGIREGENEEGNRTEGK